MIFTMFDPKFRLQKRKVWVHLESKRVNFHPQLPQFSDYTETLFYHNEDESFIEDVFWAY